MNTNQDSIAKKHFWIHSHPKTIKILKIATYILGLSMIAAFPALLYAGSLVIPIATATTGGIICVTNYLSHKVLNVVACKHDMKTHAFKPSEIDGAKLYYKGDVPILSIETTDPHKAGYAHGYLLGTNIDVLRRRLHFSNKVPFLPSHVTEDKVPNVLNEIQKTIPDVYLEEMKGLVDGFNKWASEKFYFLRPKKMTLHEAILFHLMPDSMHFSPESLEYKLKETSRTTPARVACTVCIDKDEKGISFGRNMDWTSYGVAGPNTLIIKRKTTSGIKTVDIALLGLIGALTGMNNYGLSLAMNVCPGHTVNIRGMPAIFLNRFCLENAKNVDKVKELLDTKSALGPYHLTVADSEKAQTFHFYQDPQKASYKLRKFADEEPLIVTNFRYDDDTQTLSTSDAFGGGMSCRREQRLKAFLKDAKSTLNKNEIEMDKIIEKSLAIPEVNNFLSTHSVVMSPKSKEMRVAFDNAYSASNKLHRLTEKDLFS